MPDFVVVDSLTVVCARCAGILSC